MIKIRLNSGSIKWSLSKELSPRFQRFFSQCSSSSIFVVRNNPINELTVPDRKPPKQDIKRLVKKLNKKKKRDTIDRTSRENILFLEIQEALEQYSKLSQSSITIDQVRNPDSLISPFLFSRSRPTIILSNINIIFQTSEGEGLALVPKSLYASAYIADPEDIFGKFSMVKVPKTIIGDKATVKLLMHHNYVVDSELIEVTNADSRANRRKDELIICNKFKICSGCHLQMLTYDDQLKFKQNVIKKAYRFFYPELLKEMPNIENFGIVSNSPMQYAYRTKLTPHYDIPKHKHVDQINIGFNHVNPAKGIVDINNCPIASPVINQSLPKLKNETLAKVAYHLKNSSNKKIPRGHTLLLRESLRIDHQTGEYDTVCFTDHKKIITERIEDFVFQFPASEFFQNNNSILPQVLDYIRYHINYNGNSFKYIVDTYCGSGFFGISLSKDIPNNGGKVFGIELSKKSIDYATHNAKLNGIKVPEKVQFIEGSADNIFTHDSFVNSNIKGKETIVIMDPSRKGSNESFMKQLLNFKPKLIFYISCNVFTQARDLALFKKLQPKNKTNYKVREVVGFDFFPQTKHVESVAVLELIEKM